MKFLARTVSVISGIIAGAANVAQAGEVAEDSKQKCLELTRIAADSMRLTPADEEWCGRFGRLAEINQAQTGQPPGIPSRPAQISHAEIAALISRFISQNPKYISEPLAAKTMYSISALASGELR